MPRLIRAVFDIVEAPNPDIEWSVTASFIELYKENARDLLVGACVPCERRPSSP